MPIKRPLRESVLFVFTCRLKYKTKPQGRVSDDPEKLIGADEHQLSLIMKTETHLNRPF